MVKLEEAPQVGGYRLLRELYRNRFGIHYVAQKQEGEQKVLLQVVAPEIVNSENFVVRFELLRGILPTISNSHLLRVEELGRQGELAYIAKEHPSPEELSFLTLGSFDPRATANRHRTLEFLFEGITQGLIALNEVRNGYYKEGIHHDLLVPDKVFITFEEGLIGGSPRPIPKLDGYWESFLFFGDSPEASLRYRLEATVGDSQLTPYSWEQFLPPSARRGAPFTLEESLFSLGALIQQTVAGVPARGAFPGLREVDPTLDPRWDEIQELCFAPTNDALTRIRDHFKGMAQARAQLSPKERKLKNLHIPDNMVLVTFDEKVELGAADGPLDQQPRFRARIRPFLMDLHPVTVEEFTRFQKRYQPSSFSAGEEHPATAVSWTMAKAYLRWRDEQEGLPPGTYRLPTEYEWEAACRGGDGEQYPWGERSNGDRLHSHQSKEAGAIAVKQFPPGRFGLHDMLGNVWEWTESIYKPHPFSEHVERGYAAMLYVTKGGCWFSTDEECRGSLRAAFAPHECKPNIGFRAVRPLPIEDE